MSGDGQGQRDVTAAAANTDVAGAEAIAEAIAAVPAASRVTTSATAAGPYADMMARFLGDAVMEAFGDDDVTESAIAALLGIRASPTPVAATPDVSTQTPELYAGSARGQLA